MFKRTLVSMAVTSSLVMAPSYAEEEKLDDIEVIQVSGIRGSLTQAISLKKENVQIVDSIIAEDIGKFPDNNVVEALQRVSGVQTTGRAGGEVSTVTIRGLGDVSTTVNGREIFTSTSRNVALADIPASLLNSVDVYKTRSANLIEGGIAGQIDIKTHRPFNFQGSKVVVAARGIYMDSSEKVDPSVSLLASNRWDTSIGEVGALFNASYAKSNYRDQNIWVGSLDPYNAETYERIYGFDEELPTGQGSTINVNGVDTEYVLLRDAMGLTDYTGERERPAMNLSLQWAPNDTSEYLFEAFYNGYRNESFNSLLFVNTNGTSHFRSPTFYEGTNVVKTNYINNANLFTSGDGSTGHTDSYVFALGGKWDIGEDLILNSEIVYQTSTYKHSFVALQTASSRDQLALDFNYNGSGNPAFGYIDNPDTDYDESSLTDANAYTMNNFYDNSGKDEGDALTWTLDGDYALYKGIFDTVDFGLRYNKRTAKSQTKTPDAATSCSNNGGACILADIPGLAYVNGSGYYDDQAYVPSNWLSANAPWMLDNIAYMRELYGRPLDGGEYTTSRTFDIEEESIAAYVQTNYATELFGKFLDGQIGVRVVNSSTDINYIQSGEEVSQSVDDTNVLPSFMARYYLTDDLLLRFSYGKTITQPSFADLNPNTTYNEPITQVFGTATSGNPNLKPVESQNYDLSLEYYFAESSSVYGVLFTRDVDGFVYGSSRNIESPNADGEMIKYVLTQPMNAGKGKLEGFEFGFTYFPDELPNWLQGIGVQASYTYLDADSKDPIYETTEDGSAGALIGYETNELIGVSKNSYSVVLAYEKEDYSARLSYVYRDKFLMGYANGFSMPSAIYSDSEANMDFQFSWNVTPEWVLTFDATNLTGEEYHTAYTDFNLFNSGSTLISRTYAIGTRYAF